MRMHYMQGLLKYTMTDDLELLIAEMAREKAHHHQCSLAEATRQIRGLVTGPRGISCRWHTVRRR